MRKQNGSATNMLTDDIHRINERLVSASERTTIWILIQEEKTNLVAVNHGRLGTACAWKKEKVHCSESYPLISYFTSFFIFKCDDLWKNRVIQKVYHLFITKTFSRLLKLSVLLFQKSSKSTYGLSHMGIILYHLVFIIM